MITRWKLLNALKRDALKCPRQTAELFSSAGKRDALFSDRFSSIPLNLGAHHP